VTPDEIRRSWDDDDTPRSVFPEPLAERLTRENKELRAEVEGLRKALRWTAEDYSSALAAATPCSCSAQRSEHERSGLSSRVDAAAGAARVARYAKAIAYRHRDITPLPAAMPVDIWIPEARSAMAVADEERAADRAEIGGLTNRLTALQSEFERLTEHHVSRASYDMVLSSAVRRLERAKAAEARLDALVDDLRGLADDLAVEIAENRGDLPPVGPGRIAHIYRTAGLSDAHDRLRSRLDKHAGEQP
jgi:hypothetical protein